MGVEAQPAPWESVPARDQLFVLITGANSGIGLGIGQRLIDDFLATRPLSAHLVLLPTTRSAAKSRDTIRALRTYAATAAAAPHVQNRVAAAGHSVQDTVGRIHVLSLQVDLCDLPGVYALAETLCDGTVSNPEGLEGEYLRDVRIPRLDSVVFNAAYGGWSGVNWLGLVWSFLTQGLTQSVTWPNFKTALPTRLLNEQPQYNYPAKPLLGEVFTACVFGHYVLAHQLLPLLSRSRTSDVAPGRIIWSSSIEALDECYSLADPQSIERPTPYESAKRLTDILALTSSLPSVRPFSTPFLRPDAAVKAGTDDITTPPAIYLTHPGIVASTLFPLPWFLMGLYETVLLLVRMIGSPWHTVDPYSGAKSAAWVALEPQDALDSRHAHRVKWGSSSSPRGNCAVKRTEVERWGFEGRVEDIRADDEAGMLRKAVGRKRGALDVTEEDLAGFEELGARCWGEMERLRHEWEDIIGVKER